MDERSYVQQTLLSRSILLNISNQVEKTIGRILTAEETGSVRPAVLYTTQKELRKPQEDVRLFIKRLMDIAVALLVKMVRDMSKPRITVPDQIDSPDWAPSSPLAEAHVSVSAVSASASAAPSAASDPHDGHVLHANAPNGPNGPNEPGRAPNVVEAQYKPPELQDHFVVVDSSTVTGTSQAYRVDFAAMREVVELEFLQASVPNSSYNVSGVILFQERSGAATLTASIGGVFVTMAALASALTSALNTVAVYQTYAVTVQADTSVLTIAVVNAVAQSYLALAASPLLTQLGLVPGVGLVQSGVSAVSLQPHPYLLLCLDNVPTRTLTASTNCFLPLLLKPGERTYFSSLTDMKYVVSFVPPLESLTHLNVSWKTWDNQPVDFHGLSHQLIFRIATWTGSVRPQPRSHVLEIPRRDPIDPDLAR